MNNHKKTKIFKFKKLLRPLSNAASIILHIGLPIIFLYLLIFLFITLSTPDIPGYILSKIHYHTLEHIVMSATLIVIGALTLDIVQNNRK